MAENLESAIAVMEDVAQYVGLRSRNKIWYSLNRCYKRAKYIPGIRGIEQIEDTSDTENFLQPKCMLGGFIGGEFQSRQRRLTWIRPTSKKVLIARS